VEGKQKWQRAFQLPMGHQPIAKDLPTKFQRKEASQFLD
jgi:hypothetical protein